MEQWCVQAYAKKREPELEKEGFQLRYDSFGLYYYGTFTNDHVKSIRRQLRHLHIKYLMYAQRWERSSTYRKNFLKSFRKSLRQNS